MLPDLQGIMFHPTGFRINLLVFLLVCRNDIPGMVEQDAAGTGSALVYGSNVFWHNNSLLLVIIRDFSNPVPRPGMLFRAWTFCRLVGFLPG